MFIYTYIMYMCNLYAIYKILMYKLYIHIYTIFYICTNLHVYIYTFDIL